MPSNYIQSFSDVSNTISATGWIRSLSHAVIFGLFSRRSRPPFLLSTTQTSQTCCNQNITHNSTSNIMFGLGKRSDVSKSSGDDETSSQVSNDAESPLQEDVADGEFLTLVNALEEPSPPLAAEIRASIRKSFSTLSDADGGYYGHPLTAEQAATEMPAQEGKGLGWFATVIPDVFFVDGKLRRGLNKKDFDIDNHTIKPRRASIPVTETDLFSSITKIDGPDGSKRYIFHGVLNGWPALQNLELVSLEQKRDMNAIPNPKDLLMGKLSWTTVWQASQEGTKGIEPALKDHTRIHRAKLRAAPWSAIGWSKTSPGFVFWFEAQRAQGARVCFGTDMTHQLSNEEKCTNIHMISHRYGRVKESAKDRITYHSICLLEWDHGNYCTVVESAYLNGMGGYQGKSKYSQKEKRPRRSCTHTATTPGQQAIGMTTGMTG